MKNSIILLLLIFLTSCTKDSKEDIPVPDQLPAITATGANTAGCIINGEVLIPKNGIPSFAGPAFGLVTFAGPNFSSTQGDDYFGLQIVNKRDRGGDFIYLYLPTLINGVGNYAIGQSNNQFGIDSPNNPHVIVRTYDGVNLGKTFLSGSNAGTISITRFDFSNGIYSGSFSLTVYNKDNQTEIIQVNNGRFDIKISTLNQ